MKYLNTIANSCLAHPIYNHVIQVPEDCKAVMYSVSTLHSTVQLNVTSLLHHDVPTICVMDSSMSLWNWQCKDCLSETPISHKSQEY